MDGRQAANLRDCLKRVIGLVSAQISPARGSEARWVFGHADPWLAPTAGDRPQSFSMVGMITGLSDRSMHNFLAGDRFKDLQRLKNYKFLDCCEQ